MNETGKDEKLWRLCDTLMDVNEPNIHASNSVCFTFYGICASKYINWFLEMDIY